MKHLQPNLVLLIALTLAAPAVAGDPGVAASISDAQRAELEARTCQVWQKRPIESLRAEPNAVLDGVLDVSFECAPHDRVRGLPLRAAGYCSGESFNLECEAVGMVVDLGTAAKPRWIHFVDTPPEKALEVIDFLDAEARKGRRIKPEALTGALTLTHIADEGRYTVTIDFERVTRYIEVSEDCGKRGCVFRLSDFQTYQNR